MRTCGNCGALLDGKVTKCPECGKNVCINCGNILGVGVTKCPKCGQATIWGGLQSLGCLMTIVGVALLFLFFLIMLFVVY